jgi:hypothetical protein
MLDNAVATGLCCILLALAGCLGGVPADDLQGTETPATRNTTVEMNDSRAGLGPTLAEYVCSDNRTRFAAEHDIRLNEQRIVVGVKMTEGRTFPDGFDAVEVRRSARLTRVSVAPESLESLARHENVSYVYASTKTLTNPLEQLLVADDRTVVANEYDMNLSEKGTVVVAVRLAKAATLPSSPKYIVETRLESTYYLRIDVDDLLELAHHRNVTIVRRPKRADGSPPDTGLENDSDLFNETDVPGERTFSAVPNRMWSEETRFQF